MTEVAVVKVPFQEVIEKVSAGEKPWYLKSEEVYKSVKSAVASVTANHALYDKAMSGISFLVKFINDNTMVNVIFDAEEASELISKIDKLVSDLMIRADDGLDDLRSKLGAGLRHLLTALVKHKVWVETLVAHKFEQTLDLIDIAESHIKTRFEQFSETMKATAAYAKEKYPNQYEAVTDISSSVVTRVQTKTGDWLLFITRTKDSVTSTAVQYADATAARVRSVSETIENSKAKYAEVRESYDGNNLYAATSIALKSAQPYVHKVVNNSTPYITQAVEVSQPYVVQAKPYIEPLVAKAVEAKVALEANKYVGPYVTKTVDTALNVYKEALAYCIAPEPTVITVPVEKKDVAQEVKVQVDASE